MLEFNDARDRIVARAERLPSERVALERACGRTLYSTLRAPVSLPPFNASAMDGYALCAQDAALAGKLRRTTQGESRAGKPLLRLEPQSACRIFTGAALPAGADTVVMQENCVVDGDAITFDGPLPQWQNVRRCGSELEAGQTAVEAGTRLSPFHLGLLASVEQPEVEVARAPRVTLIATGDELRAPGTQGTAGTIAESNSVALKALAERAGAVVVELLRVGDNLDATVRALEQALQTSDVVLTIGGVSVGDHDVVRAALAQAGVELEFWKVKMKPGKPLAFGKKGSTVVLGLPGNPVSAQLTFCLFGLPLLRAMQGQHTPYPRAHEAVLENDLHHKPGRLGFYRVSLRGGSARVLGNQSSGSAGSLAWADGLALAPADGDGFKAGSTVSVLLLDEL